MLTTLFWKKYFIVYDYLNQLIPYRDLLNLIVTHLDVKKDDLILDAGSGTGNLSMLLREKEARVIGLDLSKEGIELHKSKQKDAEVFLHDIEHTLPFPDNFFDKVCSNNTIYTISPSKRIFIFSEFYRVLKPGGVITVSNIKENFSPIKIYTDHIYLSIKNTGLLLTVLNLARLVIPTFRIFYYNYLISKENKTGRYGFLKEGEQRDLLKKTGFRFISQDIMTYSDQAILNSGMK